MQVFEKPDPNWSVGRRRLRAMRVCRRLGGERHGVGRGSKGQPLKVMLLWHRVEVVQGGGTHRRRSTEPSLLMPGKVTLASLGERKALRLLWEFLAITSSDGHYLFTWSICRKF